MIADISYFLLVGGIFVIDLVVAIHIILNKRDEPERTLLWLLTVFSFPLFGVVLYLVAGINRRETLGFKIEASGAAFDATRGSMILKTATTKLSRTDLFISKEYEEGVKTISHRVTLDRMLPDTCPLSGNSVELLCDGAMTYPMMLDAIRQAKSSIHLESFIIANDSVGKMLFDALEERARADVKVKVIYDRFGSFPAFLGHFFKRYSHKDPNFKIVPFSHANLLTPWRVQLRNHRKLLIVDGDIAFLGGINISSENIDSASGAVRGIHDFHCKIRGPAVGELQLAFLRDWCYAARRDARSLIVEEYFPVSRICGNNVVRAVCSGHGHLFEGTEKVFYTAMCTAKKSIWIMTPYFVPDKPFVKAMRMASMRGVDIRVIIPKNNNHFYMKLAAKSLYDPLLADGVRIFERSGPFTHAKAMLVDADWAFLGSSNCDVRSFRLNYELDLVITSGSFINSLREQLEAELAESTEVVMEDLLHRRLPDKIAENVCALFTPVL